MIWGAALTPAPGGIWNAEFSIPHSELPIPHDFGTFPDPVLLPGFGNSGGGKMEGKSGKQRAKSDQPRIGDGDSQIDTVDDRSWIANRGS
jgi:hypothetical protein